MKSVTVKKSKRLIENRFYKDENLTSENIIKAFNLAGWQETRDWLGRDDDLTFIKSPSRISFDIVPNSGYNFTYYKDFEPKEYAADYIIYSGRNLKELETDIEDFNNLEAKDFLKYKAPEFPWTKTIQETEMLENKELKEEVELVRYATLSSLLRKAKDQKVKQTEDHYAEVSVKAYCGGPFELKISYANSDEDEPAFFYVTFDYEDDEDRKPSIEIRLYDAIKGKFREAGLLKEMQAEGLHVESSEIQKLEDIANGQGFLFENKNSDKLKEARMRNPGREDQIGPTFIAKQTTIFFEDEGFYKVDYKAQPKPNTFRIFNDPTGIDLNINVAINGDYEDDILINTFFDSRCGSGYVIQTQTPEGPVEWAGFDKSEFKEDLEDAWVTAKKFFEANKDKHSLETWLNREVGQSISQDEIHDIIEKAYRQAPKDYFTKLLSREEFDAYKSSLTESKRLKGGKNSRSALREALTQKQKKYVLNYVKENSFFPCDNGKNFYFLVPVDDKHIKMTPKFKKQLKDEGLYGNTFIGGMTDTAELPIDMMWLPIYGNPDRYVTKWLSYSFDSCFDSDLRDRGRGLSKRLDLDKISEVCRS